jgi:hypothetical protein
MLARCKVPNKLVCKAGYRKSRSETFSRRAICRIIYYRVNSGRRSTLRSSFSASTGYNHVQGADLEYNLGDH